MSKSKRGQISRMTVRVPWQMGSADEERNIKEYLPGARIKFLHGTAALRFTFASTGIVLCLTCREQKKTKGPRAQLPALSPTWCKKCLRLSSRSPLWVEASKDTCQAKLLPVEPRKHWQDHQLPTKQLLLTSRLGRFHGLPHP